MQTAFQNSHTTDLHSLVTNLLYKYKCFIATNYIVNLNYVVEVTKNSVEVKHKDVEHSVYTSSRKIGAFKKTFMNFKG